MILQNITPEIRLGMPIRLVRRSIEDHIARLIDFLDLIDSDPDLEDEPDSESYLSGDITGTALEDDDSDTEATMSWPNEGPQHGANFYRSSWLDECEVEHEGCNLDGSVTELELDRYDDLAVVAA